MIQVVTFKLPVYKNQAVGANKGKIIEVGDSVDLVISNDGAASTIQAVTVTAVANGGTTISWDASTTGNLNTEYVERVHFRHNYNCLGALNYQIVLTESSPDSVKAGVTSWDLGSPPATYAVGVTEAADAGNGMADEFIDALQATLNALLGAEGTATVVRAGTAGTQTLTITVNSLTMTPGAFVLTGLSQGSWAVV